MKIKKKMIADLPYPYSISIFHTKEGKRIYAAPEKKGKCISFLPDGTGMEKVWAGEFGGTTGISQLGENEEFLAIDGALKGFQCEHAGIIHGVRKEAGWKIQRVYDLPFVHRLCVIRVEDTDFVLAATLCAGKAFKEDWSQPGALYLGTWKQGKLELKEFIGGLHKNHGMFLGQRDQKPVVIIGASEGLFEISIPEKKDGQWKWQKLISDETSDVSVYDMDRDGRDEIVSIRGFHGDEMVIYKEIEGKWEQIYHYPIRFGHVVWAGNILGKPSILLGYRGMNGALMLFRTDAGCFHIRSLDDEQGPINIEVCTQESFCMIYCTCGMTHQITKYTLCEEADADSEAD